MEQWNTNRTVYSAVNRSPRPRGVTDELFYFPAPPPVDCLCRNVGQLTPDILQSVCQPAIRAEADFDNYLMYLSATWFDNHLRLPSLSLQRCIGSFSS